MNRRSFVGRLAALVGCGGLLRAAPEIVHVQSIASCVGSEWRIDTNVRPTFLSDNEMEFVSDRQLTSADIERAHNTMAESV